VVFECLKGILWRLWVGTVIIKHYSILTLRSCLKFYGGNTLRELKRGRKGHMKTLMQGFGPWTPVCPQFTECNALGLVIALHFSSYFTILVCIFLVFSNKLTHLWTSSKHHLFSFFVFNVIQRRNMSWT
jgi:hypothetical protein